MSKTVVTGPNSAMAKVNADLVDIFDSDNCLIVYLADGSYLSWQPDSEINGITSIVAGKGYIIIMKSDLDVSNYFVSLDDLGGGAGVMNFINTSKHYIGLIHGGLFVQVFSANDGAGGGVAGEWSAKKLTQSDFDDFEVSGDISFKLTVDGDAAKLTFNIMYVDGEGNLVNISRVVEQNEAGYFPGDLIVNTDWLNNGNVFVSIVPTYLGTIAYVNRTNWEFDYSSNEGAYMGPLHSKIDGDGVAYNDSITKAIMDSYGTSGVLVHYSSGGAPTITLTVVKKDSTGSWVFNTVTAGGEEFNWYVESRITVDDLANGDAFIVLTE